MTTATLQVLKPSRRIGLWTLQSIIAAAFLAAGGAKIIGVPFMVQLFQQIGFGQGLRLLTGFVEIAGAAMILTPRLSTFGALWLGGTMVGAVATHLLILHTSPIRAIVLGLLNVVVLYLRRDELAAFLARFRN